MAGLRPLSVIPVAIDEKLPLTRALYSRDNLCATTQQQPLPLLFISLEAKVHVYSLLTDDAIPAQPSCVLQMPADLTQREESGEPSYRWQDGSFYFIKIAPLDNTEVLITANNWGFVCLWLVSNLQEPWLILDSNRPSMATAVHDPYYFKTYPEVDPFVQSNESIATDSDSLVSNPSEDCSLSLEEHTSTALPAASPSPLNVTVSDGLLSSSGRPWILLHSIKWGVSLYSTRSSFWSSISRITVFSQPLPHQYGILTGYWHLDAIEWVSELGVAIIACQMGELALIRLIQDNTSTAVDEYICILEQYLPPGEHEDEVDVFSPRHRLIGFSVSRRECNDPQLRRYLLYFIYTDGIYSTYELRQPFWSLSAPLYNFL